jgi:hypothetical protein
LDIGNIKNQIGIKLGDKAIAFGKIEWDIDKNIITFDKPVGLYKNKN